MTEKKQRDSIWFKIIPLKDSTLTDRFATWWQGSRWTSWSYQPTRNTSQPICLFFACLSFNQPAAAGNMINEFRLSWNHIQYFFLAAQPGHRDFDPFEKRKYCNTASTRSSFRYQQQWLTIRCRVQYNEYNSIRDTNQSKHTIFRGGTLRVMKATTSPTLTKTCREFPSAFYICSVIARANPYGHGKVLRVARSTKWRFPALPLMTNHVEDYTDWRRRMDGRVIN